MTLFVPKLLADSDRHKFVMTQNVQKRCCWYCCILAEWFTSVLPITLLLQWRAEVYKEMVIGTL